MRALEKMPFSRLLRNALLTFLLVGTVALFSYGAYSWQREERDVRDNLQTLSGFLASASLSFFDELGNGLEPLGELLDEIGVRNNPDAVRSHLVNFQIRHPQVSAVAIFAPDGEMLLNTAVAPGRPLPDIRKDPSYIKQFLADLASPARYTVGPPELGKVVKLWRFSIRHVVRGRDGKPEFLVQLAIPLEKGSTFLPQMPVSSIGHIGLLRANGYQQARFPTEDAGSTYGRRSPGPDAHMILAHPGVSKGYFSGGSLWLGGDTQTIGAFTKLLNRDIYAYVSVPAAYLVDRWWRNNAPILISFILFFAAFVVIAYRVTKRERSHSRELVEQAERDALTGLPNRGCLNGILDANIRIAQAGQSPFAILFLDLDRFKGINDTLGHAAGDKMLVKVAQSIQPLLRRGDMLGRFGGDEFLLILPGSDESGAVLITQRVLDAFTIPFEVDGRALRITPSIGIAVYPDHGTDIETLLKHADTAMYESKRLGRNAYTVYADQLGLQVRERLELEHALRDALERDAFRLVYQPIVDMQSGEIVAVEALVRWMMPDGQLRAPGEFIQAAEDSGFILPLGQWVLRTACSQLQQWVSSGSELRVAVNLSTHQFQDPKLMENVLTVLRETGLDAKRLELEITESAAMLKPEASIAILGALAEHGVRIAIDDFGTGYSSLSYLKRIPADTIKIDKAFVDEVVHGVQDATIVRAVVALARALEKDTIAEGIETEAQFDAIRRMGCDSAQGYWISRPLEAEALTMLLARKAPLIDLPGHAARFPATWIHSHGKR
jgi:diguanylate cyclase (GGDEF)-like protein